MNVVNPKLKHLGPKFQYHILKFALIFILFDIEIVFIFPWIMSLSNSSVTIYYSFITFIIILFLGWICLCARKIFKWEM